MEREERRKGCPYLTEHEIDAIAEKAAEKAVEKFSDMVYQEVGKNVLSKLVWIIGASFVAFAAWLHSKGFLG
jgi:predicted GTPase